MFAIWIAFIPFVMWYSVFEGPKVWWLWVGGAMLTGFWIIRLVQNKHVPVKRQDAWFLGWLGILGIASIFGVHPLDSFIGGGYRHQGVLFFYTLYLVILTLRTQSVAAVGRLRMLMVFGVIGETALVLSERLGEPLVRPLGSLGEPNAVAGYLAVGLWWILTGIGKPVIRWGLALLTVAAIAATQSRTGLAVAGTVLAGYIIINKMFGTLRWVLVGGIAILIAAAAIITYRPVSLYENRPLFWQLGFREFVKRPLLGYGAESGEYVYTEGFASINTRLIDLTVDRAHNLFLDVALWSGVIGVALFCGWLGYAASFRAGVPFAAWVVFAFLQPLGVVHWILLLLVLET